MFFNITDFPALWFQVISFLAAVLHKKGTREDIENNMPEFLRKKKESRPIEAKKVSLDLESWKPLCIFCFCLFKISACFNVYTVCFENVVHTHLYMYRTFLNLSQRIFLFVLLKAVLAQTSHLSNTLYSLMKSENLFSNFLLFLVCVFQIFLIVAPLSVLYNWKDELDTWGYFRGTILHGTKKEAEFARVKRGKCEFALTTYETLRLCLGDFNR